MKNWHLLLVLFFSFANAQNIFLNKVVKTHENTDKFFYRINNDFSQKEYLGEIEVRGFTNKDQDVFSYIYKQAKQIGANAYSLKQIETIDGSFAAFDPSHYLLNLYYIDDEKNILNTGDIFIVSANDKTKRIDVNGQTIDLPSRSFVKIKTLMDKPNVISTRKLFGSSIKFNMKASDASKYFEILPFQMKGDGSLNFKTGDILGLEASYGQFLTMLYREVSL